MSLHLTALARPDTAPINHAALYAACRRGDLPAEVLTTRQRERLVCDLWGLGWTDVEIATHTRMSTYTAARIRGRLGLEVRRRVEGGAA